MRKTIYLTTEELKAFLLANPLKSTIVSIVAETNDEHNFYKPVTNGIKGLVKVQKISAFCYDKAQYESKMKKIDPTFEVGERKYGYREKNSCVVVYPEKNEDYFEIFLNGRVKSKAIAYTINNKAIDFESIKQFQKPKDNSNPTDIRNFNLKNILVLKYNGYTIIKKDRD